jgi:hypothetical protein
VNPSGLMADPQRPGRARPNDPLMQEVRWRLFRREDLPARLRRLERLEQAAFSEPRRHQPPPREQPRPGGEERQSDG